jgi:hypothetical protein
VTIRDTAAALARALVGGEQGRRIDDPVAQAVTEGRIPRDRYSSCADLPHALRYLTGLRARVNRREAGSYQSGTRTMAWLCEPNRVGARLGHPCAVVPRTTTRFDPGDTIILDVGHADRTHTCIVLEHGATELVTADYGQHPFLGQRPEHIACRVVRRPLTVRGSKLWAGDRPIDSVLPLEAELAWAEREGTLRPPKPLEEWLAGRGEPPAPAAPPPPAPATASPAPDPAIVAGCCWGLDVSSAQAPGSVDWAAAARQGARYGVVQLSEGVDAEPHAETHCAAVRGAGMALGAYAFFIPWREPAALLGAFESAADRCGYGHPGDVAPWLDVESWQGATGYHRAAPDWAPLARATLEAFRRRFGLVVLYLNHSDWVAMGCPDWIGEYPLAAAHYGVAKPLTAGGLEFAFWQDRVTAIPGVSSERVDHSWARLPLLTLPHPAAVHAPPAPQRVDVGWIDVPWDRAAHDRLRNAAVARHTAEEPL